MTYRRRSASILPWAARVVPGDRNNVPHCDRNISAPQVISIREAGPRDGLQNEDLVLPAADKIRLIDELSCTGLHEIEAGSFVHPRNVPRWPMHGCFPGYPARTGSRVLGGDGQPPRK
jgi:hypothetical protein